MDTDVLSSIDGFSMKPYYRINREQRKLENGTIIENVVPEPKPQMYLTFLAINKTG